LDGSTIRHRRRRTRRKKAAGQGSKKLREYRPGTFDKRVAYGQRERKLILVARGILHGFKVKCGSEKVARNLAYSLRIRATRIESNGDLGFAPKVRVEGAKVFVVGVPKRSQPSRDFDRKD
jgi:hypothetical protein